MRRPCTKRSAGPSGRQLSAGTAHSLRHRAGRGLRLLSVHTALKTCQHDENLRPVVLRVPSQMAGQDRRQPLSFAGRGYSKLNAGLMNADHVASGLLGLVHGSVGQLKGLVMV